MQRRRGVLARKRRTTVSCPKARHEPRLYATGLLAPPAAAGGATYKTYQIRVAQPMHVEADAHISGPDRVEFNDYESQSTTRGNVAVPLAEMGKHQHRQKTGKQSHRVAPVMIPGAGLRYAAQPFKL